MGKTELAQQYALQHLQDYPGGICWLRAIDQDVRSQVIQFVEEVLRLQVPKNLDINQQIQWCWQNV